jgi:ketosteroid isomerase-like protein
MQMRILTFLVAITLLVSVSCSRGRKQEDPAAAQAAATRAHEAYVAAINSNRVDAWIATLSDDVVYLVPNKGAIVGKEAVGSWLTGYLRESTTQWTKTLQDLVVSGDWAIGRYEYHATDTSIVTDTSVDGGGTTSDSGWGLIVYHRDGDGTWRVARDAWGSNGPSR